MSSRLCLCFVSSLPLSSIIVSSTISSSNSNSPHNTTTKPKGGDAFFVFLPSQTQIENFLLIVRRTQLLHHHHQILVSPPSNYSRVEWVSPLLKENRSPTYKKEPIHTHTNTQWVSSGKCLAARRRRRRRLAKRSKSCGKPRICCWRSRTFWSTRSKRSWTLPGRTERKTNEVIGNWGSGGGWWRWVFIKFSILALFLLLSCIVQVG